MRTIGLLVINALNSNFNCYLVNFITTERPAHDLIASSNKLALMMDEEQLRDVNDEYIIMIDENAENRWMNWMPDPYDANPSKFYK